MDQHHAPTDFRKNKENQDYVHAESLLGNRPSLFGFIFFSYFFSSSPVLFCRFGLFPLLSHLFSTRLSSFFSFFLLSLLSCSKFNTASCKNVSLHFRRSERRYTTSGKANERDLGAQPGVRHSQVSPRVWQNRGRGGVTRPRSVEGESDETSKWSCNGS